MNLKFWIFEGEKFKEKRIDVTNTNYYPVKFWLEQELEKLRKQIKKLYIQGIITNIKHPQHAQYKDNKYVKQIDLSRSSIINSLRLLKRYFKKI